MKKRDVMQVIKELPAQEWDLEYTTAQQIEAVEALEKGQILLFPKLDFSLDAHEVKFLTPLVADPKAKNISYNPETRHLRCASCTEHDYRDLKHFLQRYAQYAETLVNALLSQYSEALEIGRTSFRPVEIEGRKSSYRKDDTRLHVDAFPATPNHGRRILRVFTNINPEGKPRVWRVGEPFPEVAKKFAPKIPLQPFGKAALLQAFRLTKTFRTQYDHLMLQIHNNMKANLVYQKSVPQCEIHFEPGSTWIVQTDSVSHAAMTGQYVLEQTFYLPVEAMLNPQLSPLRTLEKLKGKRLVHK
jgi:hypothetical protein